MAIHPMRVMANKTPITMFIGEFDALLGLATKSIKRGKVSANVAIAT